MSIVGKFVIAVGVVAAISASAAPSNEEPGRPPLRREAVPDVVKMTHLEAIAELAKVGFANHTCKRDDGVRGHGADDWKVVEQEPDAGTELDLTAIVTLTVTDPGGIRARVRKSVPNVETLVAHDAAVELLKASGFAYHKCVDSSGNVVEPPPSGSTVIAYEPKEAEVNEPILLTVKAPATFDWSVMLIAAGVLAVAILLWLLVRRSRASPAH